MSTYKIGKCVDCGKRKKLSWVRQCEACHKKIEAKKQAVTAKKKRKPRRRKKK